MPQIKANEQIVGMAARGIEENDVWYVKLSRIQNFPLFQLCGFHFKIVLSSPICQDDMLCKEAQFPLVHCRFGCGNSVHLKCMKLVADHHAKTTGGDQVRCPYCRNIFGSLKEIQQLYMKGFKVISTAERNQTHLGVECKTCRVAPICGNLYRCRSCPISSNICENCYMRGDHAGHFVEVKKNRKSGWRMLAQKKDWKLLPEAVIDDLQNRDLTDADYEMLKSLGIGCDPHLRVENNPRSLCKNRYKIDVPVRQYRDLFHSRIAIDESVCKCCLQGFSSSDSVRSLTCGHIYHLVSA